MWRTTWTHRIALTSSIQKGRTQQPMLPNCSSPLSSSWRLSRPPVFRAESSEWHQTTIAAWRRSNCHFCQCRTNRRLMMTPWEHKPADIKKKGAGAPKGGTKNAPRLGYPQDAAPAAHVGDEGKRSKIKDRKPRQSCQFGGIANARRISAGGYRFLLLPRPAQAYCARSHPDLCQNCTRG
jgi:hypothetical protein